MEKFDKWVMLLIGLVAGWWWSERPEILASIRLTDLMVVAAAAVALMVLLDTFMFWGYFSGKRKICHIKISNVRDFTRPHDNYNFAACRIGTSHIRSAATDNEGSRLRRKQWVKIFCSDSKQHIYRKVLGDPALISSQLELDYDSLLELGCSKYSVNTFAACSFSLTPIATTHELFMAHWRHPAEPYQIPMRVALIGLALAVSSIVLSLIPS